MSNERINVYQMITDRIIEQLEKGIVAWQKSWIGGSVDSENLLPMINHCTGKSYSLLNCMLLGKEGEYLTFNQVKAEGGSVRKGAKSKFVVFYNLVSVQENIKSTSPDEEIEDGVRFSYYPIIRYYNVFHIDDCEGIEPKWSKKKEELNIEETKEDRYIDKAEKVIKDYVQRESKLKLINNIPSSQAYYSPSLDKIVVPMMQQYEFQEEYYSTLFHEMTHSTGTAYRCDRGVLNGTDYFGSNSYSQEELVAELGAAMLCNIIGIETEKAFNNSVAYIQGWLKMLKNDKKLIIKASSKAEKAVKYILFGNK